MHRQEIQQIHSHAVIRSTPRCWLVHWSDAIGRWERRTWGQNTAVTLTAHISAGRQLHTPRQIRVDSASSPPFNDIACRLQNRFVPVSISTDGGVLFFRVSWGLVFCFNLCLFMQRDHTPFSFLRPTPICDANKWLVVQRCQGRRSGGATLATPSNVVLCRICAVDQTPMCLLASVCTKSSQQDKFELFHVGIATSHRRADEFEFNSSDFWISCHDQVCVWISFPTYLPTKVCVRQGGLVFVFVFVCACTWHVFSVFFFLIWLIKKQTLCHLCQFVVCHTGRMCFPPVAPFLSLVFPPCSLRVPLFFVLKCARMHYPCTSDLISHPEIKSDVGLLNFKIEELVEKSGVAWILTDSAQLSSTLTRALSAWFGTALTPLPLVNH